MFCHALEIHCEHAGTCNITSYIQEQKILSSSLNWCNLNEKKKKFQVKGTTEPHMGVLKYKPSVQPWFDILETKPHVKDATL
jgi:hypothetical protein